jgi:hypothetical protein
VCGPEFRKKPEVKLGQCVMTAGISELMHENEQFIVFVRSCMARHQKGDWGEMDDDDKKRNDEALVNGERLMSAYTLKSTIMDIKIWIITEWDRSVSTVLLPDEY